MKKLIMLLLFALPLYGQSLLKMTPIVSSTKLDSCTTVDDTLRFWKNLGGDVYDSVGFVSGNDTLRILDYNGDLTSFVGMLVLNDSMLANGYSFVETVVDSVTLVLEDTATASDTVGAIFCLRKGNASVVAAQRVQGPYIVWGTTVESKTDTATCVLSTAATSDTFATFNFGYFTSLAYSIGDAFGMPFYIGRPKVVYDAYIIDAAAGADSIQLVFFKGKFTEIKDNLAFQPSDADAANIIGYLDLVTSKTLTTNSILTHPPTNSPLYLGGEETYVQMIANGAMTQTAITDITVVLIVQ